MPGGTLLSPDPRLHPQPQADSKPTIPDAAKPLYEWWPCRRCRSWPVNGALVQVDQSKGFVLGSLEALNSWAMGTSRPKLPTSQAVRRQPECLKGTEVREK